MQMQMQMRMRCGCADADASHIICSYSTITTASYVALYLAACSTIILA